MKPRNSQKKKDIVRAIGEGQHHRSTSADIDTIKRKEKKTHKVEYRQAYSCRNDVRFRKKKRHSKAFFEE